MLTTISPRPGDDARTHTDGPSLGEALLVSPEVKIEPLSWGWGTWPHLVSPVQHAFNLAFRHVPLLKSFIRNPLAHAAAIEDPKMFGGPFVHLSKAQLDDARAVLAKIEAEGAQLIAFAEEFRAFEKLLLGECKGFSLEGLYERLPMTLKGVVELAYDTANHPRIRTLDRLLYRRFEGLGEEVLISRVHDRDRPFFMNTPRLAGAGGFVRRLPYSSAGWEVLANARLHPVPAIDIAGALGGDVADLVRFSHLFTEEQPVRVEPEYVGSDVRVRYMGHACVLIQHAGTSVLLDPLTAWDRGQEGGEFTFFDLPDRIDYVVLSHAHQDHFSIEMLLQLRGRIGTLVVPRNNAASKADPSMRTALNYLGFDDVVALDEFDRIAIRGGSITSLPFPGEHGELDILSKHTALVELGGKKLLFLVDSNAVDAALYDHLAEAVGQVDAVFLGMECAGAPLSWLYGPVVDEAFSRKDDESRRLSSSNADRAWRMLERIKHDKVFLYAMGFEPWLRFVMGLEYEPESVQLSEVNRLSEILRNNGRNLNILNGCAQFML